MRPFVRLVRMAAQSSGLGRLAVAYLGLRWPMHPQVINQHNGDLGRRMAGVRRWISQSPQQTFSARKATLKSLQNDSKRILPVQGEEVSKDLDPNGSEAVVLKLLEPEMDPNERREYKRYTIVH